MRTLAFLLSLVLVFTIPCENAIVVGGFGSLTRVIGLLTAAVWLGSVVVVTGRLRKPHLFHLAVFLFLLWNIASICWSFDVDATIIIVKSYVQLAILTWILWDLYMTPKALRAALQAYILGAYVTIGSTVSNYHAGQIVSEYELGRYAGAGLNAVDQSLILALGLPVAWHLATSAGNGIKGHVLRFANYAYIPSSLFAIMLTGSRMSLFAIVPAIIYIVGTSKRLEPFFRFLIFILLVGALFALRPYITQPTVDRLATVGYSVAELDLGGRVRLWCGSIAEFSEHPLLGVGSGVLRVPTKLGGVAHNTFLSVLGELGLIGFILFAVLLAIVVYQATNHPASLCGLWLTVLAIWAIGVFALTWEYRKPTWLFLSLVVVSASLPYQYAKPETTLSCDSTFDRT